MTTQAEWRQGHADRAAALIEDLTFLAGHGVGATEAAARTGFTSAKALDKYLRRHQQPTLTNQLFHQDPLPTGHRQATRFRRAS